jgi:[ribosomal protein S5]-alanine N-acetyltransferase
VRDWRDDRGYGFHIFTSRDMALVGGVNLTGVRRRAAQYASLGYWMGEAFSDKGLMSAALHLLLPAAFQEFGLHRVEAACIPENAPSRALLDKFGFRQVGLARQYLRINGSWRDHVLHELQIDDLMSSRGMLGDAAPRARLVDRRA